MTSVNGMAGMGDVPTIMMGMDLTLKCTCRVGKLLVPAWDIQTCGQYYVSLFFIALFCFLRHLLTMHKTKLILRLAEEDAGSVPVKRTSSMLSSMCCNTTGKPCSYGTTTDEERQKLTSSRIEQGAADGRGGGEAAHQPRLGATGHNDSKALPRQLSEEAFVKLGQPMSMRARLVLTAYFALISASSLFVMLVTMTFNVGVVAAILLGEGAGHLAFASDYLHNLVDAGSFH